MVNAEDQTKLKDSLSTLDQRLQAHEAKYHSPKATSVIQSAPKGMAQGIRLSIDFVAAIGVAFAIGYGLDIWLGTKPWLMIFMLPIGFVAGIFNMIRSAKKIDADQDASKNSDN